MTAKSIEQLMSTEYLPENFQAMEGNFGDFFGLMRSALSAGGLFCFSSRFLEIPLTH